MQEIYIYKKYIYIYVCVYYKHTHVAHIILYNNIIINPGHICICRPRIHMQDIVSLRTVCTHSYQIKSCMHASVVPCSHVYTSSEYGEVQAVHVCLIRGSKSLQPSSSKEW